MIARFISGEVICDQIWITNKSRTKAMNLKQFIDGRYEKVRAYIFRTVPQDTEFVRSEEMTFEQVKSIIEAYLLRKLCHRH